MSAPLPFPAPRRRPGPRTLEEEFDELGEAAPWLVSFRRGLALKQQHYDLSWQEISWHHLNVSPAQFRRWRTLYVDLVRAGRIVARGSA